MVSGTPPRMGRLPYVAKRGLRTVFQRATLGASRGAARERMSLGFSAKQVARLQVALTILLSPLDFESLGEWRTKARHTVGALLGADTSVSLLQIPGEPAFEADDPTPLVEYGAHYHQFDRVDKYRDLGTVAFTWDTIGHLWERPSRAAWLGSEFYKRLGVPPPPMPAAGPERCVASRSAADRSTAGRGRRGAVFLPGHGAPGDRPGAPAPDAGDAPPRLQRRHIYR